MPDDQGRCVLGLLVAAQRRHLLCAAPGLALEPTDEPRACPAASDRVIVDPVTNRRLHRYGGWMVFLWFTLVVRLALSLLVVAVAFAFPTYLDQVGWSAVDVAGNRLTLP